MAVHEFSVAYVHTCDGYICVYVIHIHWCVCACVCMRVYVCVYALCNSKLVVVGYTTALHVYGFR